jgi:hypothetical protein
VTGVGLAVVGLLLCFVGLRSIHLALLACGFALGWLVAEGLGASVAIAAIVAACAAVVGWVLARVVFRAALFVVGGLAGGVIGAKLFGLLEGDDGNVLLAVVFVVAVAVLTGLAAQRWHETAAIGACAFGGAGLALSVWVGSGRTRWASCARRTPPPKRSSAPPRGSCSALSAGWSSGGWCSSPARPRSRQSLSRYGPGMIADGR